MKLYCLSGDPNKPCFVLRFKSTTIMLDCSLDMLSTLNFLPLPVVPSSSNINTKAWTSNFTAVRLEEELKEIQDKLFVDSEPEFYSPELSLMDMSQIDIILISNLHNMLALPYITEYTDFTGKVLATEPTLQMASMYMYEMVEYIRRMPKLNSANRWKQEKIQFQLPLPLREAVEPLKWKTLYSKKDVTNSLSKVSLVAYNESHDVFGALKATAVSSGYRIGSCNWLIESHEEKISFISGSSTLVTHPRSMDTESLKNSDAVILTSLSQTPPNEHPDSMMGDFCLIAAQTIKSGGNVLVPCYPSGVTYDLIECLSNHFDNIGLSSTPFYFISPVAANSLAYSNIFAEWLSSKKQNRVYVPEAPFPHTELTKTGRLHAYKNIHDGLSAEMKTPCVVFTGHPSLRFGDVVHFIEIWGKSSLNTMLVTIADFPYLDAIAPFQPLMMRVAYRPIDTGITISQAEKLINDLGVSNVILSDCYSHCDLKIDVPVTKYKRTDVITLPIRRQYENIQLDSEIADNINLREISPGNVVGFVSGHLTTQDNKYYFKMLPNKSIINDVSLHIGQLNVSSFTHQLKKSNLNMDIKVENVKESETILIHLKSNISEDDDAVIRIEANSTFVICQGSETIRETIRDALVNCLENIADIR